MIEVLHPRPSRGYSRVSAAFISAPTCALLLAVAMQAAPLPVVSRALPSTTHFFSPSPFELGGGGSWMCVNSTRGDTYGLMNHTYVKTALAGDRRCGRDVGSSSTCSVLDAAPLRIGGHSNVLLGPSFLADLFAVAPPSHGLTHAPMELMVHPTARTTTLPVRQIRLDSPLCDALALSIVATISLFAWAGTCSRAGAHRKAVLSQALLMLLLLQGGAVFLPAAEAASIKHAMAHPVEMAGMPTSELKSTSDSQIISSAGAAVHFRGLAEPATEGRGQDGPSVAVPLEDSWTPSTTPGIMDDLIASNAPSARDAALDVALVNHGRGLKVTVSDVTDLISKLADSSVSHIVVASGHYVLSSELSVTRAVTIEAAVQGSVVLDAQASSSAPRRVLTINPASASDVVELIGLKVTGGYIFSYGGGIHVLKGQVTITACSIYSNTAGVRV